MFLPLPKDQKDFMHEVLPGMDIDKVGITSLYGWGRGRPHFGTDYQGKGASDADKGFGQPVMSPIDGLVVDLYNNLRWKEGAVCIWDDKNNMAVILMHMDLIKNEQTGEWYVTPGQRITRGTQVGTLDKTGNATGYIVHVGVGMCYDEQTARSNLFAMDPRGTFMDFWRTGWGQVLFLDFTLSRWTILLTVE